MERDMKFIYASICLTDSLFVNLLRECNITSNFECELCKKLPHESTMSVEELEFLDIEYDKQEDGGGIKHLAIYQKFIEICEVWRWHGELHREDGPAIIMIDGTKEWWLNGERIN